MKNLLEVVCLFLSSSTALADQDTASTTCPESGSGLDSVISATVTFTATETWVTTLSPAFVNTLTSSLLSPPQYTNTILMAVKRGSPIDLLPFSAIGQQFFLTTNPPATYCPDIVRQYGGTCPPGDITGINGCSMSVEVPGGQSIYLRPDGALAYTQAHSAYIPAGGIQCPLSFTTVNNTIFSEVSISVAGAYGFVACPTFNGTVVNQQYKVYAELPGVVLSRVGSSGCVPFDAIAMNVVSANWAAAWQYV